MNTAQVYSNALAQERVTQAIADNEVIVMISDRDTPNTYMIASTGQVFHADWDKERGGGGGGGVSVSAVGDRADDGSVTIEWATWHGSMDHDDW